MIGRRLDCRASLTAQINAAQRAAESMQPDDHRLLNDPYARHFVSHPGLRMLLVHPLLARAGLRALDRLYGGLHAHIVLRVRYADDARRAAAAHGIDQLVLLGAGFDSTCLRAGGSPLTIYEVDAASTQHAKRAAIDDLPKASTHQVIWVACDFEYDNLRTKLTGAGFDPNRRALVLWLGVTFYLTLAAIETTLNDLAALCAPGSRLVVDYGDPDIVDGTSTWSGARRVSRAVARRGEPYRTGLTPNQLDKLLGDNGFAPCDHARAPDLVKRYQPPAGAWCFTDDWLGIATAERE